MNNDPHRLYIHIGLPKTATTTLQKDLFPVFCSSSGWEYAGVSFPRAWDYNQDSIYDSFMRSIYSGDGTEFKDTLCGANIGSRPVLISEEMLTVVTNRSSWKENLINLKRIISEEDYRILLTIRQPLDAAYSYYIERYDYFKGDGREFDETLLESLDMQIYRYHAFVAYIIELFGEDRVFFGAFDKIINGDFSDIEKFLDESVPHSYTAELHNSKIRKNQKVVLPARGNLYLNLSKLISKNTRGNFLHSSLKRIGGWIRPVLGKVTWSRKVPCLSPEDRVRFTQFLDADIREYMKYNSKEV